MVCLTTSMLMKIRFVNWFFSKTRKRKKYLGPLPFIDLSRFRFPAAPLTFWICHRHRSAAWELVKCSWTWEASTHIYVSNTHRRLHNSSVHCVQWNASEDKQVELYYSLVTLLKKVRWNIMFGWQGWKKEKMNDCFGCEYIKSKNV